MSSSNYAAHRSGGAKESIAAAALAYAALGLSVIPLDGKRPALKSWTQYQQERADEQTIRSWTFGNVGIVCGAVSGNLVVLDLDGQPGIPPSPRPFRRWPRPTLLPAAGVSGGMSISTPISCRRA